MSNDPAGPGGFKPAYARAPFVFAMVRATALPGPLLVSLMSDIEGTEAANKALLHRMTSGGELTLERVGRVGVYRLAGWLLAGYTAARGDGSLRSSHWRGAFHALIYDIPEARRSERDRFLAAAHQVGYRAVRPGVLISPSDEHHLFPVPGGVQTAWITFPGADLTALVARAWHTESFRADYERVIADLETTLRQDLTGVRGAEALRALFRIATPRIELMLREGALPPELTPPDWPAPRLIALVEEAERRLGPAARAYVQHVLDSDPYAGLAQREPNPSH